MNKKEILSPLIEKIGYSYSNIKQSNGFASDMLNIAEKAMDEYYDIVKHKLTEECKRVKTQRNEYEQELMKVNRELIRLRVELKINGIIA